MAKHPTNAGPSATLAASVSAEMAAFDDLPAIARQSLRDAWFDWSAISAAEKLARRRSEPEHFPRFIAYRDREHARKHPV